jgi:hypothetical protein
MGEEPLSPLQAFLKEVRERPPAEEVFALDLVLQDRHQPTRATHHIIGGEDMPPPASLRIVRYENDTAYYLLYCDAAGREMTDTWHEALIGAIRQAEFEFRVTPDEWPFDRRQLAAEFDVFRKVPFPDLRSQSDEAYEVASELVEYDGYIAGLLARVAGGGADLPPEWPLEKDAALKARLEKLAADPDPLAAEDGRALMFYLGRIEGMIDLAHLVTGQPPGSTDR